MFNRRGVGLVEIVVGLAVLMGISLALISASLLQKQSSLTLATRDACYQVSRNVIANIKAYENDLTVRNWVPGRGNNNTDLVPANARDPLCSTARVKGVCDTDDLLAGNGLGATDRDFNNFLNRRNSATWAYSVYNIAKAGTNGDLQTSMDPAKGAVEPCAVYIADFDPQYLPSPVLPADLYGGYEGLIALKIVQTNATNAQCNTNRSLVAPLSPVFFQVTANVYLRRPGNATWETSCATQAGVGYAPDTTKAALTVEFKNLDEADLNTARLDAARNPATPYNLCLDPNNSPYSPLTWPSARGIIVDLTASEPGAYFRCDVSGSDYPTPGMRKCSAAKLDIVNSAGNRVLEGDFDWQNPSALYNARPVARGQWGSKPFPTPATGVMLPYPTPFDPARRPIYRFAFEATDVGRNQTRVPASPNEFYHFTLEPVCPPRQEYCPNRPPPDDGCGESCPVGTRQGQRCPDPLLYCPQHQPGICDDCERGGFCQPGRKGVVPIIGNKNAATYDGRSTTNPDCPDPATYYPCDIRYNWCGARCPVGTRVPPGPNPDDFCEDVELYDLCGRRYNGNQRRPDLVANPTATPNPVCEAGPANRRGQCPAASTYCTASVSGSRLKDGDGSDCADGTLEGGGNNGASVGNGGGCPDVNQYCGGNGMTLYDSCGRLCPGGYGRALPFCCAGCNSAGNPPSFKRDYSCQDFINLTGGGTCAQDQNTNCYQFTPP